MDKTYRVLMVEDHPVFGDGLRGLLGSLPDVEYVGCAETGAEAVAMARELEPDSIIMDIELRERDFSGIEATEQILAELPQLAIVVLTYHLEPEFLDAAIRAGAKGYLVKGSGRPEIMRALESVHHGGTYFDAAVWGELQKQRSAPGAAPVPSAPLPFPTLTEREREILDLIALGWRNQRIAQHFHLSVKTVANHVSNILAKVQETQRVDGREMLAVVAAQAGFGQQGDDSHGPGSQLP